MKDLRSYEAVFINRPENFTGWFYKDTDIPFDESAPITEDITIVAN